MSLIIRDKTHIVAFGLDVKLNDHSAHLQIDTGAGGLVISRSVANHAGLKAFSQNEVAGIGDEGLRAGDTAYADSIRIGNLEFQNCQVQVMDKGNLPGDVDGLIGMNVFSRFLVTLDYPMRKLLLEPLPPRPSEQAAAPQKLNTGGEDEGSDETQAPPAGQAGSVASSPPAAAAKPAPHGPYDRYIAPEMKDYTEVYRVGQYLILPTGLNFSKIKLFILDTGAWTTTISPQAAREVTKVHSGAPVQVRGLNGEVQKVYSADEITFRFANLAQKVDDVIAFDTSKISKDSGIGDTRVSGRGNFAAVDDSHRLPRRTGEVRLRSQTRIQVLKPSASRGLEPVRQRRFGCVCRIPYAILNLSSHSPGS